MKKSKPTPGLATATADQDAALGRTNQAIGTTQNALSGFLPGSNGMSEYRRALTGKYATATANTGENALARTRERAAAAGFGGGGQPITFGAETQLANEQAGRIAAIPGQVEEQVAPLELQAAGQYGQTANQDLSVAHAYDPRQEQFYKEQEEARKRKAGIWGGLAKVGLNLAVPGLGSAI